MEQNREIYIFLIKSPTKIGRMIRFATGSRYSHVSVAFDPNPNELFSFARKNLHVPFAAGFVREGVDRYYEKQHLVDAKVFKIELSDDEYLKANQTIEKYLRHNRWIVYNYFTAAVSLFNRRIKIDHCFTCLEFAMFLINRTDIRSINALENKLSENLIFKGDLRSVMKGSSEHDHYFDRVGTFRGLKNTFHNLCLMNARRRKMHRHRI